MMLNTTTMRTLGWTTTVSDTVFSLSPSVVDQMLRLVEQAHAAFVPEATAAWHLTDGEPTIISRLDCTITGPDGEQLSLPSNHNGRFPLLDGLVRPFELEERPAGLGLTGLFNPAFGDAFREIRRHWPEVRVVVAPDRRGYDDQLWVGDDRLHVGPDAIPDDGSYLIVRAEPGQTEYHGLTDRSLSSVATKGDKSYGERLGWWRIVTSANQLPSPGTEIVVLKPLTGSKARGLLFAPPRNRESKHGMVTRGRLEREFAVQVAAYGGMYLQPWHPPISAHDQCLTLRIFFALNLHNSIRSCLGGCWNMRDNVLVHGAGDTVFGPAVPV